MSILICNFYERIFLQEEHKNHGAWAYAQPRLQTSVGGYERMFKYVGRDVAPSPATGSKMMHLREHNAMMADAMEI